ncbi:CHAT domain-containing protein [Streptomyces sp. NPDC093094]|uniref:CHAT domain-containing protein n=1 Tax=Streptomyces sp. NPDC093094 TaxID=3366026 RepID=UPI00380B59A6
MGRNEGVPGPLLRSYVPQTRGVPRPAATQALVVLYRNGSHSVITAYGRRRTGGWTPARPVRVFEIALGTFMTTLRTVLPAADGPDVFRAEVDIEWRVADPHRVAVAEVTDVAERFRAPVEEALRRVTYTYAATDADRAGRALSAMFADDRWNEMGASLGLQLQFLVRLRGPEENRPLDMARERHLEMDRQAFRQSELRLGRGDLDRLEALVRQFAIAPERLETILEDMRRDSLTVREEYVRTLMALVAEQNRRSGPDDVAEEPAEDDVEGDAAVPSGPGALPIVTGPPPTPPAAGREADGGSAEPRQLVAELAEQTAPGREVPLHVQVVRGREREGPGVQLLRPLHVPPDGADILVTVHAPGLVVLGELQQELHIVPGRDSDVLLFRLKAPRPGLHQATVRAFRGGTFLGEVTCQIAVGHGNVTKDGPHRHVSLPSMAFDPGEVTLQVLRDEAAGTFSFQLMSETFYPPEVIHYAGDGGRATERIYAELKRAAGTAATDGEGDASRVRDRLRNHGVQLWTSAVPRPVRRQFWDESERITAFTVLGEQDVVPWELLYPLDEGHEDRGFLAEWLPVVRRVFGQDRVRSMTLRGAAFVVPPGSPDDAAAEVSSLRALLGAEASDGDVLTERAALTALIEAGHAGLLHFACHNAFTGAGSCVTMADGPFDPIDLASAAQLRTLRPHRPLVFFNACRSAGEIDWFGESLGWAPQFLNAGAGAFVGTLWPVRSRSALQFAEAFYDQLITHRRPLGQASLAARQEVRDLYGGDPTWLAYAVYGSPAATALAASQGE